MSKKTKKKAKKQRKTTNSKPQTVSKKKKKTSKTIQAKEIQQDAKQSIIKNLKQNSESIQRYFSEKVLVAFVWFVKVLIILSVLCLVGIFYKMLIVFHFPQTITQDLPAQNTISVFEWVQKLPLSDKENLVKYVPKKTLNHVLYYENQFLNQEYNQALKMVKPESKAIAKLYYKGQIHDLFVFNFTEDSKLQFLQVFRPFDSKWKAIFINDSMYVSQSDELLDYLATDFVTIGQNPRYQDAYYNMTKQNFASGYVNLSLLKPNSSVAQVFGTTLFTIRPSDKGVFVSTYTNAAKETQTFPTSEYKYQAKLLSKIPVNPDFVMGSQDLNQRTSDLFQKLKLSQKQFVGLLRPYNLDESSLDLLKGILNKEVLLARYNQKEYVFVWESQLAFKTLEKEISKYQAHLNATVETHTLESGVKAKNLVPNFDLDFEQLDENTYNFLLENSDQQLIFYTYNNLNYLSNSAALIQQIRKSTKAFKDKLPAEIFDDLNEIADEYYYFSPEFLQEYTQKHNVLTNLEAEDYPTIQSVSNYFLDGIQTVHSLLW